MAIPESELILSMQNAQEDLQQIGRDGLANFELNCEIWLDPILRDMDRIHDAQYKIQLDGVHFVKYFVWKGIAGAISSGPWGTPWKTGAPARATIEFCASTDPQVNFLKTGLSRKLASPGDGRYSEVAIPFSNLAIEDITSEVLRLYSKARAEREARLKSEFVHMLQQMEDGFKACRTLADLRKYFAQVNLQQPAYTDRWLKATNRRAEEIKQQAEKEKIAAEHVSLEEAERQRLADDAAALFKPFTCYKLVLGILYPDENEVRKFARYVTSAIQDEAGWYVEVNRGDLITGYRPEAPIIELYRLEIDTPDHVDAPNVCRHVELTSTEIPYLVEHALATPEGLG